ncbi:class I SAM-dependent methyltransferase [Streptomyces sp. N2-109]|uniref:Class I SAM-dependent methyltransferase n=1 Tax=Streptomyces gossypii TaxID=2883101 RepID=A0ABT2K0D2_9ACTN|nr:class I SAM-dependent methyltransferase [Streptomyces gossypii]MCT2593566.1 class I SAM-dependent methyltransferase [Streptomyces gossypii]
MTGGGRDHDPDAHARRLAAQSADADDVPTRWFERLYAAASAGEAVVPWHGGAQHRLLVEWAEVRGLRGEERSAVVVGAGLGDDAEYVARLGFVTTAFDVAPSAVREARRRSPDSPVRYTTADLLELPGSWRHAFSLVVESMTVQSLPPGYRRQAVAGVRSLLAPGGTLLVIANAREAAAGPEEGPPWPLTRAEVDAFADDGVRAVRVEDIRGRGRPEGRHWRAEFTREHGAGE